MFWLSKVFSALNIRSAKRRSILSVIASCTRSLCSSRSHRTRGRSSTLPEISEQVVSGESVAALAVTPQLISAGSLPGSPRLYHFSLYQFGCAILFISNGISTTILDITFLVVCFRSFKWSETRSPCFLRSRDTRSGEVPAHRGVPQTLGYARRRVLENFRSCIV